jgi:hypothetical protein
MKRNPWPLLGLALASTAAFGGDRAITVSPSLQSSWEFVTPGTGARLRPTLGVGFWQRASGAKPGVGANSAASTQSSAKQASKVAGAPTVPQAPESASRVAFPVG